MGKHKLQMQVQVNVTMYPYVVNWRHQFHLDDPPTITTWTKLTTVSQYSILYLSILKVFVSVIFQGVCNYNGK